MRYPLALLLGLLPLLGTAVADEVQVNQGSDANVSITVNGTTITIHGHSSSSEAPLVGNGKIIREQRPVEAATEVSLEGAFSAAITIGSSPSLILEGDENILPVIRIERSGERLRVYADHSYRTEKAIAVALVLPALVRISADGSNSVTARGITAQQFAVRMSGSNNVSLAGRTDALSATLAGSGQLAAGDLDADRTTVTISGAGSGTVTARSRLTAEINGSGAIEVRGQPADRTVHVNGSGSVRYVE